MAEKKVIQNVAKTQTQQSEQHALQGVQINVPPITFPELETVSKEVTKRQKNAIDKVLEPKNSAAQNILDSNTFQKMTDSVLNSDLAPNEKVALCKQLVEMKDESDQKHADMINENIRVRTEAAERIRASQGPTWDQIGNALLLAGKIGVKAFQFWVSMNGFMR